MSKYFYHGLGSPYFWPDNIVTMLEILKTGGIKCKRLLGRSKKYGYNGLDYVSICRKGSKEEYEKAYGSTGFYRYVQDCFCFIISDEIEAIKTRTLPKSYWYFPNIVEDMERHPERRYSDMFDEWQVYEEIPLSSIIGIGIPNSSLRDVDWNLNRKALQDLRELFLLSSSLGLEIVDSTNPDFVEKLEEESTKKYQLSLEYVLGGDSNE